MTSKQDQHKHRQSSNPARYSLSEPFKASIDDPPRPISSAVQGRALSGHRTQRAYQGYAKRTLERALPATRKRHAHRIATNAAEELAA
jgi:hypothetical protein